MLLSSPSPKSSPPRLNPNLKSKVQLGLGMTLESHGEIKDMGKSYMTLLNARSSVEPLKLNKVNFY